MPDSSLLRLLIPLVMAGSVAIGWLASRSRRKKSEQTWRDTSLDDWRREQKEQNERERAEAEDRIDGEP